MRLMQTRVLGSDGPPSQETHHDTELGNKRLGSDNLPISVEPDISGGQPVLTGTRVPIDTLLAYVDAGKSIDEYLLGYAVARWRIDAVLALPRDEVLSLARRLRPKKG